MNVSKSKLTFPEVNAEVFLEHKKRKCMKEN